MANNCYFEMKIAGEEKAVQEFIQMLKWEGPFQECGLGRVYSFDVDPTLSEKDPKGSSNITAFGAGDCAWSIKSALLDWKPYSLVGEAARLGLVVEAYSSEPGLCFQEHILVNKDNLITNDVVDYEEYWIEGADESYINELLDDLNLTREELMSGVNVNGDYCIGGFDNFGDFEDLFSYLEPARQPLQEKILDATRKSSSTGTFNKEKENGERSTL